MELTIHVDPVGRTVRLREVRALAAGDSCSVVIEGVRGADAAALRLALYRDAASDSPVASCPSFSPVRGHPNLATGDLRLDTTEMAAWFEAVRPGQAQDGAPKGRPEDAAERAVRTDGWLVVSEPTRTWAACRVPVILRPGAGVSGAVDPTSIQLLVEGLVSASMSEALASKADKATTLAGYGITDAATKSELESVSGTASGAMSLAVDNRQALSSKADKANVYTKEDVDSRYSELSSQINSIGNSTSIISTVIDQHISDTNNPHAVTAAQVGAVALNAQSTVGPLFSLQYTDTSGSGEVFSFGVGSGPGGNTFIIDKLYCPGYNRLFANGVVIVNEKGVEGVSILARIQEYGGDFKTALDEVKGLIKADAAMMSSIAPEYAPSSPYSVGAFVYHDGNIYQCKTAIADGGEAWNAAHWELRKLDDFFTNSNSLLNGRLAYERNATGLKDRAFNTLSFDGAEFNLSTALEAVTPTASGQPRDLLIVATATAATTISFTAGTIKGDKPTIDGSGTWLITLTEYASGVWYCRQIKMEDAA